MPKQTLLLNPRLSRSPVEAPVRPLIPHIAFAEPQPVTPYKVVGASVIRNDAEGKVCGLAVYAGDIRRPDMAFGRVVRSPHARARVLGIDAAAALALQRVLAVLTAADVPGLNAVGTLQFKDQPVLAPGMVGFAGEAVALVLAQTQEAASAGAGLVYVHYEPLEPLTDPAFALTPQAPEIHRGGNLCREMRIVRGDFDAALSQAALVVHNVYRTQLADHGYIEPDAVVGEPSDDGVTLHVTSKSPHSDQTEVARVLGLPKDRVRIVTATVGGSFGGKPDIPLLCMAGMAALHLRRPVKLTMQRRECFAAKLKRHPFQMEYTHAVAADGTLLGVRVDLLGDAGPYALSSPSVVAKAIVHATGPYRVPNVDLHARAAYTNNPVTSAVRGYGVPQVVFAAERQMDIIARRLAIDPFELRLRNAMRPGDVTATGKTLTDAGLVSALQTVRQRVAEVGCEDAGDPNSRRAWGVAACYYGCGRMGMPDNARVSIRLEEDGWVRLFVGSPETGQGSDTVLAQIAAEVLGLPFHLIRVTSADTGLCHDSGVSSASRVTYVVGGAVQNAAARLKANLLEGMEPGEAADGLPEAPARLAALWHRCRSLGLPVSAEGYFETESGPLDEGGQGSPFGAYTFGVQASRVRVDLPTGGVEVEKVVGCFDAGTVVNPLQFQGQFHGGAAMAQGLALTEEIHLIRGVPLETNMHTYLMPTAADAPPMEALAVDTPDASGPFGAKGIGEPAVLPGAASVANAVANAIGAEAYELPLTPERVRAKVRDVGGGQGLERD